MSVSLSYLIERVRLVSDFVSSSFVTDDELTKYINAAGAELHDVLVGVWEDYLLSSSVFSLNNNEAYTPAEDILKVRGLDFQQGSFFVPCDQFNFAERHLHNYGQLGTGAGAVPTYHWLGGTIHVYPEQQCAGTYKLWFVPAWTDLVSGSNPTLAAPYTHNHWEEYIVFDAGIRAMLREESDATPLMGQKAAIVERIRRAASNRDASGTRRVADVSYLGRSRWLFGDDFRVFDDTFGGQFG